MRRALRHLGRLARRGELAGHPRGLSDHGEEIHPPLATGTAVAASTAMALRLNGISHWIMWEMSALFEHIGTVQDRMGTLSTFHAVVDDAAMIAAARL